jgi:Bacterial regulatory proteins, luxR family
VKLEQIQRIIRWTDRAVGSIVRPFRVRDGSGGVKPGARRGEPSSCNRDDPRALPGGPQPPPEPPCDSGIGVLRYRPASRTAPEIAGELYVSHNTLRAHVRNRYAKLGTHRRREVVQRARALGLLAPPRAGAD